MWRGSRPLLSSGNSTLRAIRTGLNPTHTYIALPRHLCTRSVTFQSLRQQSKPLVPSTLPRRLFSSSSTHQARYVRFGGDPKRPWDISKWDLPTKIAVGVVSGGVFYYVSQYAHEILYWILVQLSHLLSDLALEV